MLFTDEDFLICPSQPVHVCIIFTLTCEPFPLAISPLLPWQPTTSNNESEFYHTYGMHWKLGVRRRERGEAWLTCEWRNSGNYNNVKCAAHMQCACRMEIEFRRGDEKTSENLVNMFIISSSTCTHSYRTHASFRLLVSTRWCFTLENAVAHI